jgi:D-alanyl-lipoteichoic acid acyltransferase DltB (MBOAT superfamily)
LSFVSFSFAALLLIVLAARLLIGRRKTEPAYLTVLLVASLVFYGWHVPWYLTILLASSAIDYVAALALARWPLDEPRHAGRRKMILAVSLGSNLGLLGLFKYAGFGVDVARGVARQARLDPALPDLELLLPMGISFYTFQSMSYTIDVYRGQLQPLRGFAPFLLYISFFPSWWRGRSSGRSSSCRSCRACAARTCSCGTRRSSCWPRATSSRWSARTTSRPSSIRTGRRAPVPAPIRGRCCGWR